MKPKFYMGEDVIIQASTNIQFNGLACVITDQTFIPKGMVLEFEWGTYTCRRPAYFYKLSEKTNQYVWWNENCLIKRPADYTLKGLIQMLKIKEPA